MLGESPVLLDTVLFPFRGSIMDGLVVPYHICFIKSAAQDFPEEYMKAKRNHIVIPHQTIEFLLYMSLSSRKH